MPGPTEGHRSGLDYLQTVTVLLNRIRTTDPRAGLYEAAELQWWWAQYPRVTDDLDQLFWFDADGRPSAAAIVTDWRGEVVQMDPLLLPDAPADQVAHVVHRGLDHAAASGFDKVQLEVDTGDEVLREVLIDRGFARDGKGITESWLSPEARPPISPLADGYHLVDRAGITDQAGAAVESGSNVGPHHMKNERRDHIDPEPRLQQTSLYRADLDLVIHDGNGDVAAYGLFWHDPTTGVGIVEPMRTNDGHQGNGLARHLLTTGIDRLAHAGSDCIKICFDPDNAAAKHLYLSTGFEPDRHNDVLAGPTASPDARRR